MHKNSANIRSVQWYFWYSFSEMYTDYGVSVECGWTVNESLFHRRDENHKKMERKIKHEIIFTLKAKRKNRQDKKWVICNIYEMISLVYSHCRIWANRYQQIKLKNQNKKRATWIRVSSSSRYFNLYSLSNVWAVSAVFSVRADVIGAQPHDELARFPSHIAKYYISNWKPFLKLFVAFAS